MVNKIRCEIISVDEKTDKNNKPFTRIRVQKLGKLENEHEQEFIWLTDFSSKLYNTGETMEIIYETNKSGDKEFHNVKTAEVVDKMTTPGYPKSIQTNGNGKTYPKDPVGLAVDVFNAMMNGPKERDQTITTYDDLMMGSIRLVKQAQKAFE